MSPRRGLQSQGSARLWTDAGAEPVHMVRYRRAMMLLSAAGGNRAPGIAQLV